MRGVEECIANVDEQVDHHDDDNDERNAAHNDGPVTHANGAIDLIADTGPVKDRLGQDGARKHARQSQHQYR